MPPGNTSCSPETTTCYVFTYDGRLVREYLNNATQRDFLYAGSQRIGVSEKIGAAFRLHYFITDHLGSTRSFIDSTGLVKATYNYYPFGGTRTSTVTTDTKRRYTGKELDDEDIQQYYYGARYLNGATQCFNSVDPLAAKYPGWSPYCYALANPVRNMDTKGEWVETALDVASVALSYRDFHNNPTWGNAGWLALDAVSALLPLVPAVGIIRHAGKIDEALDLVKGVEKTTDAGRAADKAIDAAKTTERTGDAAEAARSAEASKVGIYEVQTNSGKTYVGQSGNIPARIQDHIASGKVTSSAGASAKITPVRGGKTAREIAEQKRIDALGGVKNLENVRNPVGEKRKHLLEREEPSRADPN